MARQHITTTINGDSAEFLCDTEQTLLDVLRDELRLTGSKEGCASGDCGACSVTLDGRLVCACLVLAAEVEGREVTTIEGMTTAIRAACRPIDDKRGTIAYRTQVSGVLAGRACRIALQRAEQS